MEFDSPHVKALPRLAGWVVQHPAAGNVPAYARERVVGQVGQTWCYTERLSFTRAVSAESWAIGKRAFEISLDWLVIGP